MKNTQTIISLGYFFAKRKYDDYLATGKISEETQCQEMDTMKAVENCVDVVPSIWKNVFPEEEKIPLCMTSDLNSHALVFYLDFDNKAVYSRTLQKFMFLKYWTKYWEMYEIDDKLSCITSSLT